VCVDTTNDPNNCGSCGNKVGPLEVERVSRAHLTNHSAVPPALAPAAVSKAEVRSLEAVPWIPCRIVAVKNALPVRICVFSTLARIIDQTRRVAFDPVSKKRTEKSADVHLNDGATGK
jgi:hypothetical protein